MRKLRLDWTSNLLRVTNPPEQSHLCSHSYHGSLTKLSHYSSCYNVYLCASLTVLLAPQWQYLCHSFQYPYR